MGVDPDGEVTWSLGDPSTVVFPRSANKPFQALGMVRSGLPLDGAELALASASHSAEPFHVEGVRAILARAGLDESALQTPPSYPLDGHEHAEVLRAGGGRAPISMDCSGKHAAMLLTCVENGWSTHDYLAPEHPLQVAIVEAFADAVGARPDVVGVDGCGAPLLATGLAHLARGISSLMTAPDGSPEARVRTAMTEHPEWVSGTRRDDLALARAVPGALVKSGAEAVVVVGLPDGRAFALKIEDGAERPLFVVARRILQLNGVGDGDLVDPPAVLGGGRPVGEVRPAF